MSDDLLRALQTKLRLLDAVNVIGKSLTASLNLREVLTTVVDRIRELQQPRACLVLLENGSAHELQVEVAIVRGSEHLSGTRLSKTDGLAGWAAEHQQSLLVKDALHDARSSAAPRELLGSDPYSIIAVPLITRKRTLGVIELVNGEGDRSFNEDDVRLVEMLAEFAAIGIDNARSYQRIEELTILDEHTALYNSRFLYRALQAEVERARRFSHPLSLLFLDLDHFKRVNDTHGHAAGTALLAEMGRLIQANLRSVDIAVRYGGDEFVVLLPETGRPAAVDVAGRLRGAIARNEFLTDRGLKVGMTASFGAASYPDDARTAEDLLKAADAAMYLVKSAGRDSIGVPAPVVAAAR